MMADRANYEFCESGVRLGTNRRGLITALFTMAVGTALLFKYSPTLALPHIWNNPTNLLFIRILILFGGLLGVIGIWQSWRLLFEIKKIELDRNVAVVHYWNLSPREFGLPIDFRLRKNIRLVDPANKLGFRNGHLLSAGLFTRIVVPTHIGNAEQLLEELLKK